MMLVWPMFDSNRTSISTGLIIALLITSVFSLSWYLLYRYQAAGWSKELFSGIVLKLDVQWTNKYIIEHFILCVKYLGPFMLTFPVAFVVQSWFQPGIISSINSHSENKVKFNAKLSVAEGVEDMRKQLKAEKDLRSENKMKIEALLHGLTWLNNLSWLKLGVVEIFTLSTAFFALAPIAGVFSITIPGLGTFALLSGPSSLAMYINWALFVLTAYKVYSIYSAFRLMNNYNHEAKNSAEDKEEYAKARKRCIEIAPPLKSCVDYMYPEKSPNTADSNASVTDDSNANVTDTPSDSKPQDVLNQVLPGLLKMFSPK